MNTPVKSPARRVLGSLTPKAINTPLKHRDVVERAGDVIHHSPLKQVQTLSQHAMADAENIPPTIMLHAARKRSIHEVDDVENPRNVEKRRVERDAGLGGVCMHITAAALEEHTATPMVMLEDDEELTPTEPNTPEPVEEELSQQTNGSTDSFSNWVNYDPHTSSQNMEPQPQAEPQKPAKIHADNLRLRLQFALYKVKTNRTRTPLSEIELELSAAQVTPYLNASNATPTAVSEPQLARDIAVSPVRRDFAAPLHVVANLDSGSTCPKLQPGPLFVPTAFSSRFITDYVPSSPPVSRSTASSPKILESPLRSGANTFATPVTKRQQAERDGDDVQGEEHAEEEQEDEKDETIQERSERLRARKFDDGDLTSSVVKGRAASGLLELMKGQR
jgi:hypothetical protein